MIRFALAAAVLTACGSSSAGLDAMRDSAATTDGTGYARASITAGSTVIVTPPATASLDDPQWRIVVFVDVDPGETLHVGALDPRPASNGSLLVHIPTDGIDVQRYTLAGPGVSIQDMPSATTVRGTLDVNRPPKGDVAVGAVHYNGVVHYAIAHDVALVPGDLDMTTSTWMDATPVVFTFTNAPTQNYVSVQYEQVEGGRLRWSYLGLGQLSGTQTVTVPIPGPGGDQVLVTADWASGDGTSMQRLTVEGSQTKFDLAAPRPPDFAADPQGADGTLHWSEHGGLVSIVATVIMASSPSGHAFPWVVVMSPTHGSYKLRALPADVPIVSAPVDGELILQGAFVGASDVADYAAYRIDPFAADPNRFTTELPVTVGRRRYSSGSL